MFEDDVDEKSPLKRTKWVTHEATDTSFEIKPLSAEAHNELRKSSVDKKGEFDVIVFSYRAAKKVIVNWRNVGRAERDDKGNVVKGEDGNPICIASDCNDVSKIRFGKRAAYSIMPWLIGEARDFDEEIEAGEAEAKNA